MPIDAEFRRAIFAPETGIHVLLLVTLSSPDLAEPIRLCRDAWREDAPVFVSRGLSFVRAPFGLAFPRGEGEASAPRCVLEAPNIDHRIREAIEAIRDTVTVLIETVTAEEPDVVQSAIPGLVLEGIDIDPVMITARIAGADWSQEPWPFTRAVPANAPGAWFR